MKIRGDAHGSTRADDQAVDVWCALEERLIGKDTVPHDARSIDAVQRRAVVVGEVSISASAGEELAGKDVTGEHQMIADPKTKAALEYKGYQALVERAVDVFDDELIASRWLSMPSADLNGDVPLYIADKLGYAPTEMEKLFEPIFIRIEHGIDW